MSNALSRPADISPRPLTTRPLRLLWLIDSFTVGGAESLVVPFVRRLKAEDAQLTLCCMTTIAGNAIARELESMGIAITNLGARNLRDISAFRRLLKLIRENEIDLIHAHLTYSAIWASLASRLTGVPSIASLHVAPPVAALASSTAAAAPAAANSTRGERLRDRLMRFLLNRWASRVVAVSDALRDRYLSGGGIAPSRFVTVRNGIEVERFARDRSASRARLEQQFHIPPDAQIVVTVSVLRPGKGIEVLLEAIADVAARAPKALFLIVGDGPLAAEWNQLAIRSGVAGRVRWAGYRRDIDEILAGCDLFVLPSLDDAFPTVLLEAMAASLPVVATRVGGIPEIVSDDTGSLVPPGDAAALADAIVTILAGSIAPVLGQAGRIRAVREFSTDAWIGRLLALYAAVSAEKRPW